MLIQQLSGMLHFTVTFCNREDKHFVGLRLASNFMRQPQDLVNQMATFYWLFACALLQVGCRFRFLKACQ